MDLPGETLEPGKPEGNAKSKMPDDLEYIECQKRTGTEVGMIGMMVGGCAPFSPRTIAPDRASD